MQSTGRKYSLRDNLDYDNSSIESIFNHALRLTGNSLEDLVNLPERTLDKNSRGRLGNLVETYYFGIQQNSEQEPDFKEVGLELKVTGVTQSKTKKNLQRGTFQAKERLVLTMIDFEKLISETWSSSALLKKAGKMLILFYLFDRNTPDTQRKFVLEPMLYEIPNEDLVIIQRDWETIRSKVEQGKAHELSEGDTYYLGACRKGSGGVAEKGRRQPNSQTEAPSRAFCLKQSYVSRLVLNHSLKHSLVTDASVEQYMQLGIDSKLSFEDATKLRYEQYIGRTVKELSNLLGLHQSGKNQKGFHRMLANRMLSGGNGTVVELQKAGIELKTIRLNRSGNPREAMSFPGFKFQDIVDEKWEDSSFFQKLEQRFLFVIYQTDAEGIERLIKVAYWNMPYQDRVEAEKVWEETKRRVKDGITQFPKSSENRVAHVRPKARNKQDTLLTPQGVAITKQCFWLNNKYIADVINAL